MQEASHPTLAPSLVDQDAGSLGDTSSTAASALDGTPSLYDEADLYDAIVQPGPREAFYREQARQWGGPVLELACGTGRLTLPLARDGHEVLGLGASRAMLDAARRKAAGLPVRFVLGDMRDFDLGGASGSWSSPATRSLISRTRRTSALVWRLCGGTSRLEVCLPSTWFSLIPVSCASWIA